MSEDYAVDSIDTGLRLPILYNVVFSVFNAVISISYIILLARVLIPSEFLAYSSIFTFYTLMAPLLTRVVQWSARDYVRLGDDVKPLFSGLYTLTLVIGVLLAPTFIHLFIKSLTFEDLLVIIAYGVVIITYSYAINVVALVGPRFFNLILLISLLTRFSLVFVILFIQGSLSYIIPLSMEVVGYTFAILSSMVFMRGRISLSLFIPSMPSTKYVVRIVKLSIANYINVLRGNLGDIHYFIAFFMGLADILVNSLWIVYRILNWGKSFFRGFFIVVYSRQFYRRMSRYDFTSYLNLLLYLIVPMFMMSLVIHRSITSIFNPQYVVYSQLVPIAILLIFLESLRITFLRLVFGSETIDANMDGIDFRGIFKSRFFTISFIQIKVMVLSILMLLITSIFLVIQGSVEYVPFAFLIYFIFEAMVEVIIMYRKVSSDMEVKIDYKTPLYLVVASIPSLIYLSYIGANNIIVRDIFPDVIPLLLHISIAFTIYVVFSLLSGWVRKELKGLIKYVFRVEVR